MPRKISPQDLPQKPLDWHASMRTLDTWITPADEFAFQPTILVVTVPDKHMILGSQTYPEPPEAGDILNMLSETMQKPDKSSHLKPHRPRQVIFEDEQLAASLKDNLEQMGISVTTGPAREEINNLFMIFESLTKNQWDGEDEDDEPNEADEEYEMPEMPGILDAPGNTPEMVGRVWAAGAAYYRAAPWRFLADGQPLALDFAPSGKQGFVQLMGNGGMQFGIVFHWNWEDVLNSYQLMGRSPMDRIPSEGWNVFSFEESAVIPDADLQAIKKYRWEIAQPNAYPMPLIYFAQRLERPNAEMLGYYEAALRAIPQFVDHLQPDEEDDYLALEMPIAVETIAGPMTVTVRYPAGELPASIFLDEDDEDFEDDDEEYLLDPGDEDDEEEDDDKFPVDERAFEGMLAELGRGMQGSGENLSPELRKAQDIIYHAWEENRPARRVALARKALQTSPDCADAYVLLAEEEAETPEEACELYEKGVQAGERALGKDYFTENKGMFWGLLETRGYMRARAGLAECLEYLGRGDETQAHFQALLELNPSDNQGIRYNLLALLVRNNKNSDAGKLLEAYAEDASAAWAYSRALLAFRRLGPSAQADAALRRALRANPHVAPYLTGLKPLPEEMPDLIGFGDENEAIDYAAQHFGNWWNTRGAVPWLKEIAKGPRGGKDKTEKSKPKDKKKHRR